MSTLQSGNTNMKSLLSRLPPSYLSVFQKNVENQIVEFVFGTKSKLISQTIITPTFPYCDTSIMKEMLNFQGGFTVRLPEPVSKNNEVISKWPDTMSAVSKDTIFCSFAKTSDDPDVRIYDMHQKSKLWWKAFINKPLSLSQKIQPNCCEILYHTEPLLKEKKGFVIERTWAETVKISGFESLDIICNLKSTMACMNTFLHDSMISVDGYNYLKLHYKFAPIQASIVVDPNMQNDVSKLLDEIFIIFERENIRYEFSDCSQVSSIHEENDKLGTPFSIILSDSTVTEGIVGVRDRNTHFVEPMNFRNLIPFLKQNLSVQAQW